MGLFHICEKLSLALPEQTVHPHAPRPRQRYQDNGRLNYPSPPLEVTAQLETCFSNLQSSMDHLMHCIETANYQRVAAQRLCYDIDSELYDTYNNDTSRSDIKKLRTSISDQLKSIQQQLLSADKNIAHNLPPIGRKQVYNPYELCRMQNLRELRALLVEFLELLVQLKSDLKHLCNSYCEFISEKYFVSKCWNLHCLNTAFIWC